MIYFIFGGVMLLIMGLYTIDVPEEDVTFSITKIKKQNKKFSFKKEL